ncbi:autotransporter domain-containing protein [Sphingomonas koreensis]|uniref:Autotransporter domain-containing protein n=1 Tax=Sphingomonas koreensis TaxID=93064 RepID=A0A430FZ53_9SPHN|nr:autotransporter domain-containing protein [Sphingomonas koreensis]
MASLLPHSLAPVWRRRRASTLHRTVSGLALMVGSMSLVGLSSPAKAQCVENPANVFTCSGSLDSTQTINRPTVSITTTPGFTVDTISNGGGSSFEVNGQHSVSYIDIEGSRLAGGGAYFTSGTGDLTIVSNGEIDSDLGLQGLGLATLNGGDINVTWNGHINNSSGEGVRVTGTGDVNLLLSSVYAQDGGIEINQNGPGGVSLIATGDVTSDSARGVVVNTGLASTGDISLDLKSVTASGRGVNLINRGSGASFIRATGPISGVLGIRATNDVGSGEMFVDVADISGIDAAFFGNNYGVSDTFIRTRDVFSESTGLQMSNDVTAGNLTIITRDVVTGSTGISAVNQGTGATSVTVQGSVTTESGGGVYVFNDVQAQNLSVWTQDVQTGAGSGIGVSQEGSGSAHVRADGLIVSQGGTGIRVNTGVQAASVTVAAAQDVFGEDWGVLVDHSGSGGVAVVVAGDIVGELEDGVWVNAGPTSGYVTLDLQAVSGGDYGIRVDNAGLGGTVIRAAGPILSKEIGIRTENETGSGELLIDVAHVSGVDAAIIAINNGGSNTFIRTGDLVSEGTALSVDNGASAVGLTVFTGNVQANEAGISVDNGGTGETLVVAEGVVTAVQGDGVSVSNSQLGQSLRIDVDTVMAGDNGVSASHTGTGVVTVNTSASVIGAGGDGIRVYAGAQSTGTTVSASAVTGGQNGIAVNNFGGGDTAVRSTGWVVGNQQDGVAVNNGQDTGDLVIETMHAVGAANGISALNQGAGLTSITTHGLAQGADAGINVSSLTGGDIVMGNFGSIRGDQDLPTSRAVRASGGAITLENAGVLLGTVELWGASARLRNADVWNTSNGESLFSGADDQVINLAGGLIFAAGDAFTAETTRWTGLERFDNGGSLWLTDGGAGDTLLTSAASVFQAGSTLGVDFGGVASDVFRTEGALEIQTGSKLALNQVGALTLHHRYVVAEAQQGVTGRFDFDDVYLTAFAGLRDGYTATQAYVEFGQLRSLAEAGLTPNQKAAAGGADSLPAGNPLKDALLMLASDEVARGAFDQLSGEVHATVRTALVEDSRVPREAVLDRLADADSSGSIWARGFEGGGTSDGNFNAARGDRDGRGMMVGLDRPVGGAATIGAALGVMKTEVEVDRRASRGEVESIHGVVYGGVYLGAWRVSAGLGYARTVTQTKRSIAFPGFQDAVEAKYDGSVLQGFLEAGYRVPVSGGWVEPFASVAAVRAQSDAFVEKGGDAALSGEKINEEAVISTLGIRFETAQSGSFSVRGMAGWQRNWGDVDPVGRHRFEGGDVFEVLGAAQSENAAVARLEARCRLTPRIGFGVGYGGVLGSDGVDHAVTGVFRVAF